MPRIIDGERNNMVGEQVRYYRKKENTARNNYQKSWKLWRSISVGDLSLESKTGQERSQTLNYMD